MSKSRDTEISIIFSKNLFMRKVSSFKLLLVAIAMVIGCFNASAQLLVENFDYTVGAVLTTTATADPVSGWLAHSGNGTSNVDVVADLAFTGYAGSGIGGAANLDATGQDINKIFSTQTNGTVYTAFIIQTASVNNSSYFLHLGSTVMGTTFFSRVWINATGTGVGVTNGSTAPFTWVAITAGIPTLIVLKHDFATHITKLYVLNSYNSTEPETADVSIGEILTEIGSVGLRQYNAAQKIIVDGIRIGTTWAEAVAPSYSLPIATPTFSPAPGIYTTSQSVTLNSTTPGASIYYSTDGTDPNNSGTGTSTLYTSGTLISINSSTVIKAIVYLSGMTTSNIGKGIYTFPTEIATISALRAADPGGIYRLTANAVITFQSTASTGKPRYIQDGTAGILLFDGSSKISGTYNLYDGISGIVGTLTTFNGMLEYVPFTDPGTATSTNNVVTPTITTLANLANYSGQLVKIKNVMITGTGNFIAATSYVINDGTAGVLRTNYSDVNYLNTATSIPTTKQEITGVVFNYSTTAVTIVPRSIEDFVNSAPTITVTEVTVPTLITSVGTPKAETLNVSGVNLTDINGIGLSILGTDAGLFSLSTNNIPQTGGIAANTVVTITYSPVAEGSQTATLTLTSAGAADVTRTLNGTASPATGLSNPDISLVVSALNGNVLLTAKAGETVAIYNAIGQKLVSKIVVEGLNTIPVTARGVVIVKVGTRVSKVIL